MKKTQLLLITLLLITFTINANGQSLKSIFDKYGKHTDFELVSVNKPMLSIARTFSDKEGKEVLAKISGLKILTSKQGTTSYKSLIKDVTTLVKRNNFESLVEVRDKGERVNIYFKESGKNKSDLLIVTHENEQLHMVWVYGKLSMDDFKKFN